MGFLASLFGAGDAQATGDELDAKLREINERDYKPGGTIYQKAQAQGKDADKNYELVQNNLDSSETGWVEGQLWGDALTAPLQWFYDPAGAWDNTKRGADIATDGVIDGAGGLTDLISEQLKKIIKALPWWVWLLLIGYLAWTLMGPAKLKKMIGL